MRWERAVAIISIVLLGLSFAPAKDVVQRLGGVKSIYVASLGTEEGAELIRQKIAVWLINSKSITVVESAEDADAILTGMAQCSQVPGHGYSAVLVVRLNGKSNQLLWTDDVIPMRSGTRGATSNIAENMVTDLLKAIAKDKKSK